MPGFGFLVVVCWAGFCWGPGTFWAGLCSRRLACRLQQLSFHWTRPHSPVRESTQLCPSCAPRACGTLPLRKPQPSRGSPPLLPLAGERCLPSLIPTTPHAVLSHTAVVSVSVTSSWPERKLNAHFMSFTERNTCFASGMLVRLRF